MELVLIDLKTGELLLVTEPTEDNFTTLGNMTDGNPMELLGEL